MNARRARLASLGLLALAACAGGPVAAVHATPVVPVTFDVNLLTARQCEFRGTVTGLDEAETLGANLVVAFVYEHRTFSHTSNGVTVTTGVAGLKGKAVKCPPAVLDRVLRGGDDREGT